MLRIRKRETINLLIVNDMDIRHISQVVNVAEIEKVNCKTTDKH